ncbi:MAG: hypothetical protein DRN95_07500, partial [Candidatus Hydrothermarchaeota archaeon]
MLFLQYKLKENRKKYKPLRYIIMESKFCKLDRILAPFDKKIERRLRDIKDLFVDKKMVEKLDQ